MISLIDMRPAWRPPAGAQQRRLPLWHKRLAEIIDLAKNLDDPIQHHRLHHSAIAAYLKKPFTYNPLIARKPLIRVIYFDRSPRRPFNCVMCLGSTPRSRTTRRVGSMARSSRPPLPNPPSTSSSTGASPKVRPDVANRVTPGVCDRKA